MRKIKVEGSNVVIYQDKFPVARVRASAVRDVLVYAGSSQPKTGTVRVTEIATFAEHVASRRWVTGKFGAQIGCMWFTVADVTKAYDAIYNA